MLFHGILKCQLWQTVVLEEVFHSPGLVEIMEHLVHLKDELIHGNKELSVLLGSVNFRHAYDIVIPKGARDLFGLTVGQRLIVLSDENGIALIPDEAFMTRMQSVLEQSRKEQ